MIQVIQDRVPIFLSGYFLGKQADYLEVCHFLYFFQLHHTPLHISFINAVDEQPVLL